MYRIKFEFPLFEQGKGVGELIFLFLVTLNKFLKNYVTLDKFLKVKI